MTNFLLRLLIVMGFALCTLATRAEVVLSLDLNDVTDMPDDTAPGFAPYFLSDETLNLPPFSIDVNSAGGAVLDDVHRATPATTGTLTLGALYRDAIFASATSGTNFFRVGLDAQIGGLTPGRRYTITAWSFESGAGGTRTSDWSVLGLGGAQFVANNYSFTSGTTPANDTANRFSVTAYADGNGRIALRGRPSSPTTTPQVFLNGFTVDALAGAPAQLTTKVAIDFNDRGATGAVNTHAGFSEFILAGADGTLQTTTTRSLGAYTATLTSVGGTMDDRTRAAPSNSAPFTEALLLKDFVFTGSTTPGQGIDLRIQGLVPNQTYVVELWSFDANSPNPRTSDWTVNAATLWDDYFFDGNLGPTTNDDAKMTGTFTASASGELLISGRVAVSVVGQPMVFLDAVRISEVAQAQIVDFGRPIISEFLADNEDGITDEDGDASDWVEIWNTTSGTLDLGGWRLTDDPSRPGRWVFPAGVTVPSQGRLLVWATGKNRTVNPAALHTTFGLSRDAEAYLALLRPDATVASAFTNLPEQYEDRSYGVAGTTEPLTAGYFVPPTPLGANGPPVPGFVADTAFDFDRGFYSAPFALHITCATPGAQIYYTTDGSEPTTASTLYPGSAGIPIFTTSVVRAKAFAPPLLPSNTDTQTYVFRAHVQNQPANPAGWPATWGIDSVVGEVPGNYEMDPAVVNTTLAGYGVPDALAALPTLSVAMAPADFHSTGTGIYANPRSTGDAWERACSLEFLELDGTGFNTTAGIRVHGNASRTPNRMQKHQFRLAFRGQYGDGRLNYRIFPESKVQDFNKLILHGFFTDGWGLVSWTESRYRPWTALSFRDEFIKRTFEDMGHAPVSGRFAHLYINGLYWGIYRIGERIEDDWCVSHFGGAAADWDVIAFGEPDYVRHGTGAAWDGLFTLVNSTDLTVPANHQTVAAQVDLANFADYYLLHAHGDAEDWPHHNGYAIRNRVAPGSKWQFVTWDQELSFDPLVQVNRWTNVTVKTAGELLQRLKNSAEFRLLFADRAHKHLHNDGALSVAKSQARWQSCATLLDKAIVAESARWGDTADETPYGSGVPVGTVYKRETDWLPQVNLVKNSHLPSLHNRANGNATIPELIAQTLWPSTEPPVFNQFGGNVPVNFMLTMSAPAGTIYYTLDGTDPRQAFTGNAVGNVYAGGITLGATTTVKARALNGGVWSALSEARFIAGVLASSANLAITELLYDPLNADHEFIELTNFSAQTIDLTGVYFEGITFTFADGTLLAPGERIVVARDLDAFASRYGNVPRVAGEYTGALDNNGEVIAVIAENDLDIARFRFENNEGWPDLPPGGTHSIVLRSPTLNPADPINWRTSAIAGGTPASSDSVAFTGTPLADVDLDGLFALLEYAIGTSDTVATENAGLVAKVEEFEVNGVSAPYLTLTARVASTADDATLRAEFSLGLTEWDASPAAVVYLGETYIDFGNVIRKWRAAQPFSAAGFRQFFRLRVDLP